MSGWDLGPVSSANLLHASTDPLQQNVQSRLDLQNKFRQFLRTHQSSTQSSFPYRDTLKSNYAEGNYSLLIDLDDLRAFDSHLLELITTKPAEHLPIFEEAAKEVASLAVDSESKQKVHDIQIQLTNYPRPTPIRALCSDHVSRLVSISGIVVSASRPRIKATQLSIMCRNCKYTDLLPCAAGFGGARLPRLCQNPSKPMDGPKCPQDPYMILADTSAYIDQQRLKLQETPGDVPTGELPRHLSLAVERYLVGAVKPGTRVTVLGMYTTYEANSSDQGKQGTGSAQTDVGIRIPYLRVFGIEQASESSELLLGKFAPEDEEAMHAFSRQDNLYKKIASSMCPAIFDNEDIRNIKMALAVQLFGGARKFLPDGMRLRGDINILLLGDPSVAKSQFLKFVSQVAPIGVYTSGKGSSAAGLTASVIRDPGSGEFHLEGGALVLADGGLVCIDEFDKMRDQDRVAIHEAMEQQTISIAKAGITTILNSRTSVLAAANPIFGRYDDMRSPTENIDFQTTILSRFDLIFIVRDLQDSARDQHLAKHVLRVHRYKDAAVEELSKDVGLIKIDILKKYIAFARQKCDPRLSAEAAEMLKNQYVKFRSTVAQNATHSGQQATIPITVRQLEAVVRISEALARMELSSVATVKHVEEALRLFQVSTYRAATAGLVDGGTAVGGAEFDRKVRQAENLLVTRLAMGATMSRANLVKFAVDRGLDDVAMQRAIDVMVQRNQLKAKNRGLLLERVA